MAQEHIEKKTEEKPVNWLLHAWNNCLRQMDMEWDAAFLGDSLTAGGAWQKWFPQIRCINLGYAGDWLSGMLERVPQLEIVSPKYIFVMGGVNGLLQNGPDRTTALQKELLTRLRAAVPQSRIFAADILPYTIEKEDMYGENRHAVTCNERLRAYCAENGFGYLRLWEKYQKDGVMNPELTRDGVHLKPEGYRAWVDAVGRSMGLDPHFQTD